MEGSDGNHSYTSSLHVWHRIPSCNWLHLANWQKQATIDLDGKLYYYILIEYQPGYKNNSHLLFPSLRLHSGFGPWWRTSRRQTSVLPTGPAPRLEWGSLACGHCWGVYYRVGQLRSYCSAVKQRPSQCQLVSSKGNFPTDHGQQRLGRKKGQSLSGIHWYINTEVTESAFYLLICEPCVSQSLTHRTCLRIPLILLFHFFLSRHPTLPPFSTQGPVKKKCLLWLSVHEPSCTTLLEPRSFLCFLSGARKWDLF